MDKCRRLRELFASDKIIRIMGAHNALGAKLVERSGFDGVWASGLEISTSFGVPDANILTMTDFLNVAFSMDGVVRIPVIADCDTGFGNSNNVIHMVRKYEAAGIAAVCIEDKHFPKVNSLVAGRQELASVSEFVGKILAAKNAQAKKDFMVIARVEALIAGWGLEEALKRANAYVGAGADAILIHSKSKTLDEITAFINRWKNKVPLVVVPTTYYNVNIRTFAAMGIKMIIYANHGIRASISAMDSTFQKIYKDGSTATVENKIAPLQDVFELQGMNEMRKNELAYTRSDSDKIVVVIPAAGDHLEEYSMKQISRDIPIAMLDINGKPLLQRQVEVLNRSKIYDIQVVAGYKKEKINVGGAKIISNDNYKNTGILYSIMCGLEDITGPALVIYGDTLFDYVLLNKIVHTHGDITLILDNTYGPERITGKKKPELAQLDKQICTSKRLLHQDELFAVKKIGQDIKGYDSGAEFTGVMYLSQNGLKVFKDAYRKYISGKTSGKKTPDMALSKMRLVEFLQKIVNAGSRVNALVVNSGWLEIHSLEDYKLACSIFK